MSLLAAERPHGAHDVPSFPAMPSIHQASRSTGYLLAAILLGLVGTPCLLSHEESVHPLASIPEEPPSTTATTPTPSAEPAHPDAVRLSPSDRAIERWSRRTESSPQDSQAWVNLGNALMQRSREQTAGGLLARAEAAFERALTIESNRVEALVGLAWVHNTEHEFDAGTRYARQALAADPRNQDAYALLGDAAVEWGDYDEARDHYQKALDLAPNLASYSRAAHLLWLTGDTRRAKWLMQKAIAAGGPHAENTAWCRAELGLMLFNEGALLPAEQELEAALAAAPRNAHVLAAMGRVRAARGDLPGAIDLYARAIEVAPQHTSLAAMADLCTLIGDEEKAAQAFQRVLDYHANHAHEPDSHHGHEPNAGQDDVHGDAELARFLADHDRDLPRALAEAEAAWLRFKNVGVTAILAWCQHKNGRHEEARRTIQKALRWGTPDPGLFYRAGLILAAAGDKPGGQKLLYRALSLNPYFDPLQARLAAARLKELAAELAAQHTKLTVSASP